MEKDKAEVIKLTSFDSSTQEPVDFYVIRGSDAVFLSTERPDDPDMDIRELVMVSSEDKHFQAGLDKHSKMPYHNIDEFCVLRSEDRKCYRFEGPSDSSGRFQNLRFFILKDGGIAVLDNRVESVVVFRVVNGKRELTAFNKALIAPDIPDDEILQTLKDFVGSLAGSSLPGVKVPLGVDPRNN